jgi:biopolymer transport protein ExbD
LSAYQQNKQVQAVISADVEARHGDVVRAIDTVKSVGIENFAIQVEKASAE